jgi:hypothetical protein
MDHRIIGVPAWNAPMVQLGDEMAVEDKSQWIVEKVSEIYMTTDGQSWVDITLARNPAPPEENG